MHDFEFIVRGVRLSIKISDMLFATYEFWILKPTRSFVRLPNLLKDFLKWSLEKELRFVFYLNAIVLYYLDS